MSSDPPISEEDLLRQYYDKVKVVENIQRTLHKEQQALARIKKLITENDPRQLKLL